MARAGDEKLLKSCCDVDIDGDGDGDGESATKTSRRMGAACDECRAGVGAGVT